MKPPIHQICSDQNRVCVKCGTAHDISQFSVVKRHGKWAVNSYCYPCCRAEKRAHYARNRERLIEYQKQYYGKNSGLVKLRRRGNEPFWACRTPGARRIENQKRRPAAKKYEQENKDQIRERRRGYMAEWSRNKRNTDPWFAMMSRIRVRLAHAIRRTKTQKSGKTISLVGCSAKQLAEHIQSTFKPGMTWENRSLWHVDHIKPCSAFDLMDPEQQKACFHHTNLQALWAKENLLKGDWYQDEKLQPL